MDSSRTEKALHSDRGDLSLTDSKLEEYAMDVARLKDLTVLANDTCSVKLTNIPDFQSAKQAKIYLVNATEILQTLYQKLNFHTLLVDDQIKRTSQLKEAMSSEELRDFAKQLERDAKKFGAREAIMEANYTTTRIQTGLTSLEGEIREIVVPLENRGPQIEIPTFSGNIQDWPKFWHQFDFAIHSRANLSKAVKYTHLISRLRGNAQIITDKLDISDKSYDIAIEKLHQLYGKASSSIKDLSSSLNKLPRASLMHSSISENILRIEMLMHRLKIDVQSETSAVFIDLLRSKFPLEFSREVEKISNYLGKDIVTYEAWLENAQRAAKTLKYDDENGLPSLTCAVPAHSRNTFPRERSPSPFRGNNKHSSQQRSSRHDHHRSPQRYRSNPSEQYSERNTNSERAHSRPRERSSSFQQRFPRNNPEQDGNGLNSNTPTIRAFKNSAPCVYCNRGHKPTECPIDKQNRREMLRAENKCWTCFGTAHNSRACRYSCEKCGGNHHISLCYVQETNVHFADSTPQSTGLMIGTAPVADQQATVIFLLDTASDFSYILRETADKLKLPVVGSQKLIISTFGGKQHEPKTYDKVCLDLVDEDGDKHSVIAVVVETIADRVGVAQINDTDRTFLINRKLKLTSSSQSYVRPDVLIGIDHFFEMIGENMRPIKLPSGLHYIPTRHGGLVSGSSKKITQTIATFQVQCFVNTGEIADESTLEKEQDFCQRPSQQLST